MLKRDFVFCPLVCRAINTAHSNNKRKLNLAGWGLVITGHSLGAGVAALMALLLRGRYPQVTCWAFAPPGGLMSPALAKAIAPLCTSFVCGDDIVPRLTLSNLERLRDQVVSNWISKSWGSWVET